MSHILGYARVSTDDQDLTGQKRRLEAAGAFRVFEDVISGKTFNRPGLTSLLDHVRPGDTLAVVRLDRLGRSLRELLEVVETLKQRDVALEILSGDREPAVRAAARVLDISEWRAGVTPADKISLAAAHVSMSPIGAAHLSQSTADLVFLGKPLAPVVAAIDFSREALHLMRQNLWLAVGYNLLAVPIAISGVVTPLIAAAAMSGSSILVMLNAVAP